MNLKLTMDPDGYPTDECLKSIENEVINTLDEAVAVLRALKRIWAYADWGWKEILTEGIHEFHISTAGWSGNESIMMALHANPYFWKYSWEYSWEDKGPGGHYTFKFLNFKT